VLLNRWQIIRHLGRGGFGTVVEAEDMVLKLRLAVKILNPSMAAREEELEHFRHEVEVMRKVAHPRVVRVDDYREDQSQHLAVISMEQIAGSSARELIEAARTSGKKVAVQLAQTILEQTLEGLDAAHAAGVIHRDVTPGNILLAGGNAAELLADPDRDPQVKLADFGLAALAGRAEQSGWSRALGTAPYVAPEIHDPDGKVTGAVDIYGAGAVVYELLCGKSPLVTGHEPVSTLRSDVPETLAKVIDCSIKIDPAARPIAEEALALLNQLPYETASDVSDGEHRPKLVMSLQLAALIIVAGIIVTVTVKIVDISELWQDTVTASSTPAPILPTEPVPDVIRMAQLEITSDRPGARAWLDNEEIGVTPLKVEVEPGHHLVKLEKQGCEPKEQRLFVETGDQWKVSLELRCPTAAPTKTDTPTSVAISATQPAPTLTPSPTRPPSPAPTPLPGTVRPGPISGMKLCYIPAGSFDMGSPPDEPECDSDEVQHSVTITRGFWMGETEVTQGQWRMLMDNNPASPSSCGDDCPVEQVNWYEAVAFANALSDEAELEACYQMNSCIGEPGEGMTCSSVAFTGLDCDGFRLPTEAEWEFAARAGTKSPFSTGDNITTDQANYDGTYPYNGNAKGIFRDKTLPVRSFAPNPWGLFQVHGNVWEWCWDWFGAYPTGAQDDPTGPSDGEYRVLRGGSYFSRAKYLRSADRRRDRPEKREWTIGFRCVRSHQH
jgi:formylglycine-generating enzyme required for sulfatase activity/tRNA A-37 threonylcarbamoyl transferase component Bud32